MFFRTHQSFALVFCGLAGTALAAPPAVTISLADPQATLNSYFESQKANNLDAMSQVMHISVPEKERYVKNLMTFQLWSRYLERQAIAKFGKEEGMRVQGHLRSLDDQTELDIKRTREAGIEYNADKSKARVFLRVERGRPENLQTDRFTFLDEYHLVKTKEGWQIDYLKTFKCLDPDQEENYKSENTAYPRMSLHLTSLSRDVKNGKFKTADDLKNTLDTMWSQVYDAPVDASGRTAAETQAAAEAATTKPVE